MSPIYPEGVSLDAALLNDESGLAEEKRTGRKQDERAFYLLFLLSFPLFLMLALAGRMSPGNAASDGKSVFAEASASTRSTIAIALTN